MSKSKIAPTFKPIEPVDWTGVRLQRVEHEPTAEIFVQGDPATSVMYVERGAVRLSVLSHAGKEAVVALLDVGHFFGEGCLAGQSYRMATATAMTASTILAVEKPEMVRQLHAVPAFADRFLTHMLTRNIRIEEDLVDQLFNSTEKRLARTLLLLARYGQPEASHRALPKRLSRSPGGNGRHDPVAGELLHEQVSEARIHRLQRRSQDQQLSPERGVARLTRGDIRCPWPAPADARHSDFRYSTRSRCCSVVRPRFRTRL